MKKEGVVAIIILLAFFGGLIVILSSLPDIKLAPRGNSISTSKGSVDYCSILSKPSLTNREQKQIKDAVLANPEQAFDTFSYCEPNYIPVSGGGCPADLDGDGEVDVVDLLIVLSSWGNPELGGDVDGDGDVDVTDLLILISSWGPCPPDGEICDDGIDNDDDGWIDCSDWADCPGGVLCDDGTGICTNLECLHEYICNDDIDNEGDEVADCLDIDCNGLVCDDSENICLGYECIEQEPVDGIIYVDDDATIGGYGATWGTAFKFLQDALAFAESEDFVIEIRVAQGVYTPDKIGVNPEGSGDREETFNLVDGVTISGGWSGNGEERDYELYETILSGDLQDNDPNIEENSYHVVIASQVGSGTMLDGFIIERGNANGESVPNKLGGGIKNIQISSHTIKNSVFRNNHADNEGGGSYTKGADPLFENSKFIGNDASLGGGAYFEQSASTVKNSIFQSNEANDGGGYYIRSSSAGAKIYNSLFLENQAQFGAGLFAGASSNPQIIESTFVDNIADFAGADIRAYGLGSLPVLYGVIAWSNPSSISGVSPTTIYNSNILGGWSGAGSNNINEDPLFVNPNNNNYRLSGGSPSIDSGLNGLVPAGVTTDLDGNPRKVDDPNTVDCAQAPGQCGTPPIVDMGAYEFQG